MSRVILIRDATCERTFDEATYPLSVGGDGCSLVLPDQSGTVLHIGLEQGHPFVQPAVSDPPVWHNHQRLTASSWLKSGDRIQVGESLLLWQVEGDRVRVTLSRSDAGAIIPPASPPPASIEKHPDDLLQASTAPRKRGWKWLLSSLFGLLVAAAAFVMLATPVTLRVEPEPETMSLRGTLPAIELSGRSLLLPGDYTLIASRTGYRELRERVKVEFGKPLNLDFRLQELPGMLTVKSIPVGAQVFIDDVRVGETPLSDHELQAGRYGMRLTAPRYQPLEVDLEIAGLGQQQQLSLELKPDWAILSLSSDPDGAQITESGTLLGETPGAIELMSGPHELELARSGYKTRMIPVTIVAGEDRQLPRIELIPADGIVNLVSRPAGATVALDGVFLGVTPLQLQVSPGEGHRIEITLAGHKPAKRSVELEPEEVLELEVRLQPEYGVVFFDSRPADAVLVLNGKPRGPATARLKLPAVPHRIEIRKPGYLTYKGTVTPGPGISRTVSVVLQPGGGGRESTQPGSVSAGTRMKPVAPTGPFTMGASRREPGRRANENLRKVRLTRPFLISAREVTNGEFRRFRPIHNSGSIQGFSLNGDDQPVVKVSWDDAARYLNWLSKREDLPAAYREENGKIQLIRPVTTGYRLPTEAEWAYAARFAGRDGTARYPWPGNRFPPDRLQGNYADAAAAPILPLILEDYQDGHAVSAPVAGFAPNPIGLHDMDGNVAEWVEDFYSVHPGGATRETVDPFGPEQGRHHVVRGSGWRDSGISELRLSYRDYSERPRDDLGFRIARYTK